MNIYLDFDGTLVDVYDKYYAIYAEFIAEHSGKMIDGESFWRLKKSKKGDADILEKSGLGHLPVKCFRDFIRAKIETHRFLERDRLFPGVVEMLARLSQDHACRIVSLRRNKDHLQAQIDRLGIRAYFVDVIVALKTESGLHGLADKARALKEKIPGGKALFIGDTEEDILAGKALAMTTVAVTSGIRSRADLELLQPDHILSTVVDLPLHVPLD